MKNKHEIIKKIEGKAWEEALNKSFEKKVQKVKVDGFREGKCPRDVYEKKYGKESLFMDAVEFVVDKAYLEVVKEEKLIPIVQPTMDIKKIEEAGVEFVFTIITKPEMKIKKYKNLKVKREDIKVTDKEVEDEILKLRKQYAEVELKNTEIVKGDTAVIDFEGFKNDVPFDGGKGENYPLEIGSNTFIPGFEEQLIGLKGGDTKDVVVKFPDEYPSEELKGSEVVFKVKVLEVKHKTQRELNSEFFEDLQMDVKTLDELKSKLKENITNLKNTEAENKLIDKIVEEIGKNTELELNDEIIDSEISRIIEEYSERLKMQGMNFEQFLEFSKKTLDDFKKEIKPEANKNVLYRYIVEEIKNLENISVVEEEVDAEIKRLSKLYNMEEEEFVKAFGGRDYVKYDLEVRKTLDFLKNNN